MNLITFLLYIQLVLVHRFAVSLRFNFISNGFYRITKKSIFTKWQPTKFQLNSQRKLEDWSYSLVPASYSAVENDMLASLNFALKKNKDNSTISLMSAQLLSIDVLTPGLNPKLEQKAYLPKEQLFDLVHSTFPILNTYFKNTKILFPSTGDAAGFQSYCLRNNLAIPQSMTLTDLSMIRLQSTDDCCVFVTAKNHVGDPVIREIQKIAETFPQLTGILLNCDLSDRVASGLRNTEIRNAFRTSIVPVYYFRNIVRIERPSLEPAELGALLYRTLSSDSGNDSGAWELFACERGERMSGPGSLNRYLDQPVFRRQTTDATAAAPPRFIRTAVLSSRPNRDELNDLMTQAESQVARLQRKLEGNNDSNDEMNNNLSFEEKFSDFDDDDSCENIAIDKCLDLLQSAVIARSASYGRVKRAIARILSYKQQQQQSMLRPPSLVSESRTSSSPSTSSTTTAPPMQTITATSSAAGGATGATATSGFDRGLEMLDFNFEEKKAPAKISSSSSTPTSSSAVPKLVQINRDPLAIAKDTKLIKYPYVAVEDTVWKQVFILPSSEVIPATSSSSSSSSSPSSSPSSSSSSMPVSVSESLFGYTDNKYLFRSVFRLSPPGGIPPSSPAAPSVSGLGLRGTSEVRVMMGPLAMVTLEGTYTTTTATATTTTDSGSGSGNKRNALSTQSSYELLLSPPKGLMTTSSLMPTTCWQVAAGSGGSGSGALDRSAAFQVDWVAATKDFALSEITAIINGDISRGTKIIVLWSSDN